MRDAATPDNALRAVCYAQLSCRYRSTGAQWIASRGHVWSEVLGDARRGFDRVARKVARRVVGAVQDSRKNCRDSGLESGEINR